jgi:hypothetical protein
MSASKAERLQGYRMILPHFIVFGKGLFIGPMDYDLCRPTQVRCTSKRCTALHPPPTPSTSKRCTTLHPSPNRPSESPNLSRGMS